MSFILAVNVINLACEADRPISVSFSLFIYMYYGKFPKNFNVFEKIVTILYKKKVKRLISANLTAYNYFFNIYLLRLDFPTKKVKIVVC